MCFFGGVGTLLRNVLLSTHIVKQLLFSSFPSILIFDFVLILGSFCIFGTLMSYFLAVIIFKTVLGFTDKAEKNLFVCFLQFQLLFLT